MKKKPKMMSLVLVSAMAVSLLAGCGNSSEETQGNAEETSAQTTAETSASADDAQSSDEIGEPFANTVKVTLMNSKPEITDPLEAGAKLFGDKYNVEFEIYETDNPGKFKDIIMRRLRRGECFHMPYFGCREFPANFCLCEEEEIRTAYDDVEEKDLGFMLYDMDYSDRNNIQPMFFRAVMKRGVLDLRDCEVIR